MTVVSSQEFVRNDEMYLDLALNDTVMIQRGDNLFFIQDVTQNTEPDVIFEPDEEFYNSLSTEEARAKTHAAIEIFFAGL